MQGSNLRPHPCEGRAPNINFSFFSEPCHPAHFQLCHFSANWSRLPVEYASDISPCFVAVDVGFHKELGGFPTARVHSVFYLHPGIERVGRKRVTPCQMCRASVNPSPLADRLHATVDGPEVGIAETLSPFLSPSAPILSTNSADR